VQGFDDSSHHGRIPRVYDNASSEKRDVVNVDGDFLGTRYSPFLLYRAVNRVPRSEQEIEKTESSSDVESMVDQLKVFGFATGDDWKDALNRFRCHGRVDGLDEGGDEADRVLRRETSGPISYIIQLDDVPGFGPIGLSMKTKPMDDDLFVAKDKGDEILTGQRCVLLMMFMMNEVGLVVKRIEICEIVLLVLFNHFIKKKKRF